MCFYSQLTKDALTIAQRFRAKFDEPVKFSPSSLYNRFEHLSTPVIADYAQNKIKFFSWGLIPHWSNDISIRGYRLYSGLLTSTIGCQALITEALLFRTVAIYDPFLLKLSQQKTCSFKVKI